LPTKLTVRKLARLQKAYLNEINNSKEQFANSPDLDNSLMNAIMEALDAHNLMSSQALSSESVRKGLKAILLGPANLYESLREQR
jgi:type I restriction enzyme, R subunit